MLAERAGVSLRALSKRERALPHAGDIMQGVEALLLELREEHIEQLGVPLGHRLKIIKKIKDMRLERGLPVQPHP